MAKPAKTRRRTSEPPLTPSPARLQKALAEAARDARRLADAFGVKVPAARPSKGTQSRAAPEQRRRRPARGL